ncbi:glycerophosphodiester phosphodiesterase [uncultured Xylophilus sp.]|uniref:glycerophosphodiester phosphodiesterase n=1 Tax=uncultured Xylophilus sp. TaxID=296832 RepID=UPI0025FCBF72|nr:glycerophosphodiester phosphodiesterase [uncultured Xylophilus sp.]
MPHAHHPAPTLSRRTLLAGAGAALAAGGCAGTPSAPPVAGLPWERAGVAGAWPPRPTLIAHRGASALRPEHTLAAYRQAIADGADCIEPDLVPTRDGVLVARHENAIAILNADGSVKEATTDVADRPAFAARRTTKTIDGAPVTGWFTEDFTLAELKTLRARERIPAQRPANRRFDGQFEIPTLQEIVDLARTESQARGRTIGVYPETKHPTYFQSIGLALEPRLVALLDRNGLNHRDAPVFVQSFEVGNLQRLRGMTAVRLVQLVGASGRPYDFVAQGAAETRRYADLVTAEGLRAVRRYADAVGPYKTLVAPVQGGAVGAPTRLVADAHDAGLAVHIWTLRPENAFLPAAYKRAPVDDGAARGDSAGEIAAYLRAGIDGFFTDDPAVGRAAIDATGRTGR